MIKIFRRIRQKLINQGNLQKYLLYAIGEILLVVIGILIALQINDWNDGVKDRKLEADYFLRFKIELETNIKNIDDQINYCDLQIHNYKVITEALKKDSINKDDSQLLFIAIEHLGKTYPIEYSNNVWTELLYNGKISLIRNTEFRDRLTLFHSELLQTMYLQDEIKKYNLEYARLTGEILSTELRNTIEENMHPTRPVNIASIPDLPNQQKIIEDLKMLNGLKGYLVDIYQSKRVYKYKFEKLKKMILELVDMCNAELGINENKGG